MAASLINSIIDTVIQLAVKKTEEAHWLVPINLSLNIMFPPFCQIQTPEKLIDLVSEEKKRKRLWVVYW